MSIRILTPIEARVLGTLMEKARTVPDSYPLSLNALVAGCNQKTSRDPLTQITEDEAQNALSTLKASSLVFENQSARTSRFEHNFHRVSGLGEAGSVLLGLLMLRGPQTAGELRINSERWYRFADISAVEKVLVELVEQGEEHGQPPVARLARAPGAREQRWIHLLCGAVDLQQDVPVKGQTDTQASRPGELQMLKDRVAVLEAGLASLCQQLGVELPSSLKNTDPEQPA